MTHLNYQSGAIEPSSCIGGAWELLKQNPGLYIGVGLVTLIMISCIPFVNFVLLGPVMGGFAYIVLRDMRNEPVDFGMMFKGFEKFVPLMVVGLIQAVPGIIFQILQYTVDIARFAGGSGLSNGNFYQSSPAPTGLPMGVTFGFVILMIGYLIFQIIWNLSLTFAVPLIVENDISIGDAVKLSLGAVFSNLGGLILLGLIEGLVSIVGILAFCLGIFVAIPVIYAANVFAYRQVFPLFDFNMNTEPPPPVVYGSSFGSGM